MAADGGVWFTLPSAAAWVGAVRSGSPGRRAIPDPGNLSPENLQRLIDAAVLLFTTRGYAATSVREIVEMAGVTKPALYYHFESKEGIYLAILEELVKIADDGIAASRVAHGTARERLEAFLLGIYALFETKKAWVRMINAIFRGPAQGAPPFDFETFHT